VRHTVVRLFEAHGCVPRTAVRRRCHRARAHRHLTATTHQPLTLRVHCFPADAQRPADPRTIGTNPHPPTLTHPPTTPNSHYRSRALTLDIHTTRTDVHIITLGSTHARACACELSAFVLVKITLISVVVRAVGSRALEVTGCNAFASSEFS
jgi:hypothetical protein